MSTKPSKPIALTPAQSAAIDNAIATLSLDAKVGMIFQVDWRVFRNPLPSLCPAFCANLSGERPLGAKDAAVRDAMTAKGLGSILGGGGARPSPDTPETWRLQTENLQRAALASEAGMPLLFGNDTVHGQVNIKDATLFPHHIGQGCMRDASGEPDVKLVEALAQLATKESYACGINWIFSPCVTVPHDLRWGRTYEGFSDDPALVATLGEAEVRGIQEVPGVPMAACLKHWIADGGTQMGTGTDNFAWTGAESHLLDQGDSRVDEATLRSKHMPAYYPGLAAGCLTVMVSYSAVMGESCHGSRRLVTEVLKEELGFDGVRTPSRPPGSPPWRLPPVSPARYTLLLHPSPHAAGSPYPHDLFTWRALVHVCVCLRAPPSHSS